jgi:hypothetical protein
MKHSSKKHGEKHELDEQANEELDELVERLGRASRRLNAAAQRATHRIEALEERLVAAEPGIEVWGPTLVTEPTTFQREGSTTPEAAERVVTLGYAKVKKGKWGIVAREVIKATGGALLSDESSLLHKAERNLRLAAAPHLSALTRRIVEAVEAQTVGLAREDEDGDEGDETSGHDSSAAHAGH